MTGNHFCKYTADPAAPSQTINQTVSVAILRFGCVALPHGHRNYTGIINLSKGGKRFDSNETIWLTTATAVG